MTPSRGNADADRVSLAQPLTRLPRSALGTSHRNPHCLQALARVPSTLVSGRTRTRVLSLAAAALVAWVVMSHPAVYPLEAYLRSVFFARVIEWCLLTVIALALLSWMRLTDMNFSLGTSRVSGRPLPDETEVQAQHPLISLLAEELRGAQKDNSDLLKMIDGLEGRLTELETLALALPGPTESAPEVGKRSSAQRHLPKPGEEDG